MTTETDNKVASQWGHVWVNAVQSLMQGIDDQMANKITFQTCADITCKGAETWVPARYEGGNRWTIVNIDEEQEGNRECNLIDHPWFDGDTAEDVMITLVFFHHCGVRRITIFQASLHQQHFNGFFHNGVFLAVQKSILTL